MQFTIYTQNNAPKESKELLKSINNSIGFVPNIYSIMAESPLLLKAYKEIGKYFSESSFSSIEREVIEFTINYINDCRYCIAAHYYFDKKANFPKEIIEALIENKVLPLKNLQVLKIITKQIITNRGNLSEDDIQLFYSVGYSKIHLLELMIGVTHKTISNYLNHIAHTPIDDEFL